MIELRTELPEEMVGWLSDAANRFNVTRSDIVRRALEQYLANMGRVEAEALRRPSNQTFSGHHGHRKDDCPYQQCPFEERCPGSACPL